MFGDYIVFLCVCFQSAVLIYFQFAMFRDCILIYCRVVFLAHLSSAQDELL